MTDIRQEKRSFRQIYRKMKLDTYIYKDKKKLRCGYTTGSCGAAAAKAAARMLLFGETLERITLKTPGGIVLELPLEEISRQETKVRCAVRKDSGDDADVTDGILIFAEVEKEREPGVRITGGQGIGRVTRKGLEQEPGSYAINRVPRQMIREAVEAAADDAGYEGGLLVTLSAPEGEALAKRTFNPSLGIEGGISILGTSGIVEPMSEQALTDTIALEMRMQEAAGRQYCMITPGNYGMHFIGEALSLDLRQTVKCSNFIGDTLDMAPACHMKGVLLIGHLGKLVKLGAGIMNTHSRYGDGRMEVLTACALEAGAELSLLRDVMSCVTTDEAAALFAGAGILEAVMDRLMERIEYHLKKRVFDGIETGAVVFSNKYGLLGMTADAPALIRHMRRRCT